jgi:hypothetical protein
VTEIVAGQPVEYHVCDMHVDGLDQLSPTSKARKLASGQKPFWYDPDLGRVLVDPAAKRELAAHLLPALCLALVHAKPEVRVLAAFWLMLFGADAASAVGALRDALPDPDERVAKAARIALECIENGQGLIGL